MENIKDFILKADAEEINAAIPVPPPKPKQKVSYETIFCFRSGLCCPQADAQNQYGHGRNCFAGAVLYQGRRSRRDSAESV